tara:strand:+ start:646 stop:918 length:273 start_codon:yes stop_codon:yes gene_type:complete
VLELLNHLLTVMEVLAHHPSLVHQELLLEEVVEKDQDQLVVAAVALVDLVVEVEIAYLELLELVEMVLEILILDLVILLQMDLVILVVLP